MKNATLTILTIIFSLPLFSQRLNQDNKYRFERLMKSSQRKQTAGIIFLSAGAAFTGGGIFMITDGIKRHNRDINNGTGYDYLSDGEAEQIVGVFTTIIGVGGMAGSIPFFIGSHRSKMKAMSLSFKTENAPQLHRMSVSRQFYPALSLHIPIDR